MALHVYLKLFGIKQVFEDHNPLRLESLWALHIAFSPVQQPTGSAHIQNYVYTIASFIPAHFSSKLQLCSKTFQHYFIP